MSGGSLNPNAFVFVPSVPVPPAEVQQSEPGWADDCFLLADGAGSSAGALESGGMWDGYRQDSYGASFQYASQVVHTKDGPALNVRLPEAPAAPAYAEQVLEEEQIYPQVYPQATLMGAIQQQQLQQHGLGGYVHAGSKYCSSTPAAAAAAPAGPAEPPPNSSSTPGFVPSESFAGARDGYAFRSGVHGVGYYSDFVALKAKKSAAKRSASKRTPRGQKKADADGDADGGDADTGGGGGGGGGGGSPSKASGGGGAAAPASSWASALFSGGSGPGGGGRKLASSLSERGGPSRGDGKGGGRSGAGRGGGGRGGGGEGGGGKGGESAGIGDGEGGGGGGDGAYPGSYCTPRLFSRGAAYEG